MFANPSSLTYRTFLRSSAAYSASKSGVAHMVKHLALELSQYSIRVNANAPGFFETDLNRSLL